MPKDCLMIHYTTYRYGLHELPVKKRLEVRMDSTHL